MTNFIFIGRIGIVTLPHIHALSLFIKKVLSFEMVGVGQHVWARKCNLILYHSITGTLLVVLGSFKPQLIKIINLLKFDFRKDSLEKTRFGNDCGESCLYQFYKHFACEFYKASHQNILKSNVDNDDA